MLRNLNKMYRTAKAEGRSWQQALYTYLRNYRSTPHSTTGVTPASLLFAHTFRTRLPDAHTDPTNPIIRAKDAHQKKIMKTNADKKTSMRSHKLKVGDRVLVKQTGIISTSMTPYQLQPLTITTLKGSMVTATRDDNTTITRNASFFKPVKQNIPSTAKPTVQYDPDDSDLDMNDTPDANQPHPPVRRNPTRNRQVPQRLTDYIGNT